MTTAAATLDDLKTAFAGESQANRKYLAYAQKADTEGYPKIARLFRAAAEAETIHAHAHLDAMGGVRGTLQNLEDAIGGETYEFTKMYPPMLEQATKENHKARTMFAYAVQAEEVHAKLYSRALSGLKAGHDLEAAEVYLCPVCGHLELGRAPEKCPICKAPAAKFRRID
ncbi:MAG: rubrerythrin [Elusimicrobia bacterium GWA2_69_24]|nr:MAG: rubrerythrin [Elusimicrobia bacterium GWA2_69_24]HBL16837.1 rubrerythrin [Elusimicrobiota bacterium]